MAADLGHDPKQRLSKEKAGVVKWTEDGEKGSDLLGRLEPHAP
jgi:hypothetical protein